MATVHSIQNIPATKILIDMYNIDLSQFKLVSGSDLDTNRKVAKAHYVYGAGDSAYPITLRVQMTQKSGNTADGGRGRTNYSLRLDGWMTEDVDGVKTWVAPVSTTIAFEVPTNTIRNVTDMARFICAAVFVLFPNGTASAVPTTAKLTQLSYGIPNIL